MRWEYKVENMPEKESRTAETITTWLNERGKEGWEMIYAPGYGIFYFKRELYG